MSFLQALFGRGGGKADKPEKSAKAVKEVEHKGFLIRAEPYPEQGQYQTAGSIEKTVDGEVRVHRFIRADRFASADAAADHALSKGRQIVDEQGDTLFR